MILLRCQDVEGRCSGLGGDHKRSRNAQRGIGLLSFPEVGQDKTRRESLEGKRTRKRVLAEIKTRREVGIRKSILERE
jgi:hypothetical protein